MKTMALIAALSALALAASACGDPEPAPETSAPETPAAAAATAPEQAVAAPEPQNQAGPASSGRRPDLGRRPAGHPRHRRPRGRTEPGRLRDDLRGGVRERAGGDGGLAILRGWERRGRAPRDGQDRVPPVAVRQSRHVHGGPGPGRRREVGPGHHRRRPVTGGPDREAVLRGPRRARGAAGGRASAKEREQDGGRRWRR